MKLNIILGVSFLVLSMVMTAIVIAQGDSEVNETKRNDFNARLEHISCRIDLTKKQIDLLSGVNSSIVSLKAPLDSDYTKLQEFANALNHKEFDRYFTTTFKDNLKNAVMAIKDTKKDFRTSNLTAGEKKTLRDNHKTAVSEFANCVNEADKDWADARAGHLNAWINKWNKIIERMKEKGYDTAEMESVVADAQSKLLPALEEIKNANTKEERKTAMQNARNLHLHLWARFEIARIRSYLASIESDAIAKGYESEVNIIKNKLTAASNLAVSGKRYGPGEFESVWETIRDAAKMLKELNRNLKK